jgi:nicotinamide-nucleotide amidase
MGEDSGQLESDLESQATLIRYAAGEYIISEKGKRVEEELGIILKEKHATIAIAESCTGGYISHLLTSIAGSSAYFKGGVVAYSNEVKTSILDVNQGTLNQYGAVSREVAEEMVIGVKNRLKADYAISVTGIAGPDGGSDEKPVGTVCIAWAFADKVYSECFHFGDHRDRNIKRASTTAMAFLLQAIRKQKSIFC